MTKLRARFALRCEASGEGANFVVAADVDDRALEDRVHRKAVDHCLDLATVERAAIARKKIVDRCTICEVALAHPRLLVKPVRAMFSAECAVPSSDRHPDRLQPCMRTARARSHPL